MKRATKLLCGVLCGMLFFTNAPVKTQVQATTPSMTAPNVKEEKIVATLRSNSEAASAKWHTADFASVRLNVKQGSLGADGDWNRYVSLYMGLSDDGQGADLSEIKSLSLEAKATEAGNNLTELRWFAIDADGTVIRFEHSKLKVKTYGEGDGVKSVYNNDDANAWRGVHLEGPTPYLITGEKGLANYQQPTDYAYTVYKGPYMGKEGKDDYPYHVPNSDEYFDWTRVKAFIADVIIYETKIIDVGSLYGTDVYGEEKVLFDMGEASKANSLNQFFAISKNEYYLGPTPKYIATPETGKTASELAQYVENSYLAHNTKKDTLEVIKREGATDAWVKLFPESVANGVYNANAEYDISAYDGVAVKIDASKTTRITRVNLAIQRGTINYYGFTTSDCPALFIHEDGMWEKTSGTLTANNFPKGYKGTLIIPFEAFRRNDDDDTTTALQSSDLPHITGMRAIAISDMFNVDDEVELSEMRLINYEKDVTLLGVGKETSQTTTSAVDQSNGVPDGIRFKFSILESGYDYLEENYQNNFSLGVLVLPEPLLGEEELTIDTAQVLVIHADLWYEQTGVARYFTGVLIGIPESCKKVKCVARAYVRIGENYFYGEPIKYSYQDCYIVDGETDDDLPYDPEWDNSTHGSNDDPGQVDVFTNQVVLGRLDGWLGKQLNGNF